MSRPPVLRRLVIVGLLATCCVGGAFAQEVRLYRSLDTIDPSDVARILSRKPAAPAGPVAPMEPSAAGAGTAADTVDEPAPRLRSLRSLRVNEAKAVQTFKENPVQPHSTPLPEIAREGEPARVAEAREAGEQRPAATARPGAAAPAEPSALAVPVQFAFDSTAILPEARAQLDAIAAGMKRLAPDQLVIIEGHTDAIGSDRYNLELSERRAEAVKQYLVRVHGLEGARLKAIGLGEYRPINRDDPNAPENRRVQFRGA